ncbi:MAG TPA: potassium/proton antiporter [Fimbriimonas sp.]|nr:potassium/proton antiporter [Fimbriimonas sp.]
MGIEHWLLLVGSILVLSIVGAKVTSKLGIPVLIFFVAIGMIGGSDGPGNVWFTDANLAKNVGTLALAFILFAGGMELEWGSAKPHVGKAMALSTFGVLLTAGIVGAAAFYFLNLPILEGLLLGSIIASTDAAAVFGTLSRGEAKLRHSIRDMLEMESGSNDPIAIFLTIFLIQAVKGTAPGMATGALHFVWEMVLGALGGWVIGRLGVIAMRKLHLDHEGMFHVVSIAAVLISFGGVAAMKGNGFLAVYIAGVTLGNGQFRQRRGLRRFHDGIAWLMQILLFVTLGLLVFPSQLVHVIGAGTLISFVLMFVARPIAVHLSLMPFRVPVREQAFIAWCGLRGAVPIVLATYPLIADVPRAQEYFNIVFYVVMFSALLQGTTIPFVAKRLKLYEAPPQSETQRELTMFP